MACEDLSFAPDECASDADCTDGLVCAQRGVGTPLRCVVNDEPPLPGTCDTPIAQALPLSIEGDTRDFADVADAHDIGCSEGDVAEMVFRIEIPDGRDIHVVANDSSGQGIAVEIASATCEGVVRGCASQANGLIDERMTGTIDSVLIVERNPPGPFTLTVALAE